MIDDPAMAEIIICVWRGLHKADPSRCDLVYTVIDIMRPDSDMLNSLATIFLEIGDNLPSLTAVFVDGYADASAGRG